MLRAAEAGDAVALRIVRWAGSSLGDTAVVIARHLDMLDDEFDVVLSGGLFRGGSALLEAAVLEAVRPHAKGARLVRLDPPPVLGAVLMALEQYGVELDIDQRRVTRGPGYRSGQATSGRGHAGLTPLGECQTGCCCR